MKTFGVNIHIDDLEIMGKPGISFYTVYIFVISPGHNQNWIYSDVIDLYKMAPTFRDAIRGHISALFWFLKCSFPTVLWEPYL